MRVHYTYQNNFIRTASLRFLILRASFKLIMKTNKGEYTRCPFCICYLLISKLHFFLIYTGTFYLPRAHIIILVMKWKSNNLVFLRFFSTEHYEVNTKFIGHEFLSLSCTSHIFCFHNRWSFSMKHEKSARKTKREKGW